MAGLELAAFRFNFKQTCIIWNMAGLELAAFRFNFKQTCIIWNMAGLELAALHCEKNKLPSAKSQDTNTKKRIE